MDLNLEDILFNRACHLLQKDQTVPTGGATSKLNSKIIVIHKL